VLLGRDHGHSFSRICDPRGRGKRPWRLGKRDFYRQNGFQIDLESSNNQRVVLTKTI